MMRPANKFLLFFLPFIGACVGGFSIGNIDKPAPQDYEAWKKSGATELDVKKALHECGAPHFATNGFILEKALGITDHDESMNHFYLTNACMERSGFVNRWRRVSASCGDKNFPERVAYPACQPNAIIPERSVERRLNSWHCKLKSDREYCRQHAFVPAACDRPDKDYNNPPPECLP